MRQKVRRAAYDILMKHTLTSATTRSCPRAGFEAVLYPNCYVWFVFLSALDLMLTWVVLYWGGREVNGLANYFFLQWQLPGMVAYKFGLVMFILCVCEIVGHHKDQLGRSLVEWAVAITSVPVALAFAQLLVQVHLL
jgi:hypothetical protein